MSIVSSFIRDHGIGHLQALAACSVIANVMILAPSFHMLQIYDRVLASGSIATLVYITLIAIFALAVYGIMESAKAKIAHRLSTRYVIAVSQKIFARMGSLPQGSVAASRALRDYGTVRQFLGGKVFVGLFDLPFIPLFLLLLYFVHPTVALVTLLGIAGMAVIGYFNHKSMAEVRKKAQLADADAMGFAQAAFARGEQVRSLGLLPNLISMWGAKSAASLQAAEGLAGGSARYYALGKSFRQMLQVFLMAWGAALVLSGDMSGGMIFMCSMISGKALGPIEQLIGGWESLTKATDSYRSVEELTGSNKSISRRPALPEAQGHLAVDRVSLTGDGTPDGAVVVHGVSLEMKPGELIVLIGPTGCGKSALAKMLAGAITPTSGEVRLDGAAQDRWPTEQWGRSVGYSSDEVVLFPGTVAANIARFDKLQTLEHVYDAAQQAGVHDMILRLPKGYQTMVGDSATYLSAGQRHQIGLARAFYGQPKVFILDHPTAHLDGAGEDRLFEALVRAQQRGASIAIISRRSAAISIATRAYVMNDGRIARMELPARAAANGRQAGPVQAPANVPTLADLASNSRPAASVEFQ